VTRRAIWAERLAPAALKRIALGLAVGAAGGAVAYWLHVPLAWMLGALFFCMAASLARAPIEVPMWLRATFLIPVGLFLGESFDGIGMGDLAHWPVTLLLAILYVPVAAAGAYLFYRHVTRQDRLTAVCSSVPGGLTAVVLLSEALGGNDRAVALSQSLRITIVIFAAPIVAFGLLGFAAPAADLFTARPLIGWADAGLLLAAALGATWVLGRAGMPIPYFLGPILASAALRMAGLVDGVLPHWLVEAALVVTGSAIGCRFQGVPLRLCAEVAGATLVGTAILLGITTLFALAAHLIAATDFLAALLAFAPGGVAEMSLIALAIDADPGFVAAHHVTRIAFILLAAPAFGLWLKRSVARQENSED